MLPINKKFQDARGSAAFVSIGITRRRRTMSASVVLNDLEIRFDRPATGDQPVEHRPPDIVEPCTQDDWELDIVASPLLEAWEDEKDDKEEGEDDFFEDDEELDDEEVDEEDLEEYEEDEEFFEDDEEDVDEEEMDDDVA